MVDTADEWAGFNQRPPSIVPPRNATGPVAQDEFAEFNPQPAPPQAGGWQDYAARAADVATALVSPVHAAKYIAANPQTIDDYGRAVANALTFGQADRFAGAMNRATGRTQAPDYNTAVNEEVARSEAARERSPIASAAGDVTGVAAIPSTGIGRALTGKLAPALPGWLARGAGYGTEGALVGAVQGAGNTYTGNPLDYLVNAGKSGAMGGVLGFGFGSAFGPRGGPQSTAKTPSTEELYAEKTRNYRDLGLSQAPYEPTALAARADQLETQLRSPPHRFQEQYSPISFKAIEEMRAPPTTAHLGTGAPVYPGDIEAIRQGITSNLNRVTGGPDLASAHIVKRALDDFVRNPPPGAVLPGQQAAAAAAEASALAERARGNYGGFKRGEALDNILENARTSSGSAASGLNVENNLRQGLRSFVRLTKGSSPASRAGYNPDEVAALTEYARGTAGANFQRWVSNVLAGGGGVAVPVVAAVGGGVAGQYTKEHPVEGALAGAVLPAAGLLTKVIGNRRALREMNALGDMVRQRTPLYQERAATAPMAPPSGDGMAAARNAIAYEMMRRQQQNQSQEQE